MGKPTAWVQVRVGVVSLVWRSETQAKFLCCSVQVEFPLPRETWDFDLKAFCRFDEARSHDEGSSALLESNWL